jgi:SSS family solute:Na+ symporter
VRPQASEHHYVTMGRLVTLGLFLLSSAAVYALDSAKDSFNIILQVGAGTGLLYLVRWFWWRVTAWCEIVAMISSFAVSVLFLVLHKMEMAPGAPQQLILTVIFTTICWLITAYVGPKTDDAVLDDFYRKIRPAGPGWKHVKARVGTLDSAEDTAQDIPTSLLGWFAACAMIWSALFTVGNVLYERWNYAGMLFVVFVISSITVISVVRKLWR